MVKPEPWENPMLDTMWSFMQMGGLKATTIRLSKRPAWNCVRC